MIDYFEMDDSEIDGYVSTKFDAQVLEAFERLASMPIDPIEGVLLTWSKERIRIFKRIE